MMAEAPGYRHERWVFGLKALKTRRRSLLQIAVCVVLVPPFLLAQEIRTVSPVSQTQANDSLLVSQVVANLVARNAERAKELENYTGRRTYRLDYHGFPGNLQSQMIVKVAYRAPSTKEFTIVSETGSKLLINRVFHKLLESEEEALNAKNRREGALNGLNYEFTLIRFERTPERSSYVLAVRPKVCNKFLYRGTIWVDATDFAVWRIEAEPAKNPSFWTKKSQILQTYTKSGRFWMPSNNRTTTMVRFGGMAVLNIDYEDYELNESHLAAAAHNRVRCRRDITDLIHRMAKQPKVILQNDRRRRHSTTEGAWHRVRGGFLNRSDDAAPDGRYLEVVEEMLRQRENNGRDRDEPTGAVKDDD